MKITFDTQDKTQVAEVLALLTQTTVEVASKKPVKVATKPKEEKVIPEVEPTPKKSLTVDLQMLKDMAKSTVVRSSREAVKAVISEYGVKLTDVVEANYVELYAKLELLGA